MVSIVTIFLLKSAICSGLLMVYYLLVLKNRKMHGFNRWYLLIAAVVSLLLPLVQLDLYSVSSVRAASFPVLEVMGTGAMEEATAPASELKPVNRNVIYIIYSFVTGVFLLSLFVRIVWVYLAKRKYGSIEMNGFRLVKGPFQNAPFSYFDMIFWNGEIDVTSDEGKRIILHELVHIRQHHTLDKIGMHIIVSFCWVNPVFWLMKKELWMVHEFIADGGAVTDGDSDAFARMLLQGRYSSVFSSTNNLFFYSPIKRRIMMLTNNTRPGHALARRLMVMPLLILAILIFSFTIVTKEVGVVKAGRKITMVLDAAHGGQDAGGTGINGEREKDLTLRICRKISELAKAYNIDVVQTRETDVFPSLEDRLTKSNEASADLYLSVHVNKSTPADPRGNDYEIGVSSRNVNYKRSMILASALVPRLQSGGISVKIVDMNSVLVLRSNKHTAVVIEFGNIDDPENIARLTDDVKLEAMCRSLLSGVVDFQARKK